MSKTLWTPGPWKIQPTPEDGVLMGATILPFERLGLPDTLNRPSPAMRRYLAAAAAHPNGLCPPVMVRTERACEWRGWTRRVEVGRDSGVAGGIAYSFGLRLCLESLSPEQSVPTTATLKKEKINDRTFREPLPTANAPRVRNFGHDYRGVR